MPFSGRFQQHPGRAPAVAAPDAARRSRAVGVLDIAAGHALAHVTRSARRRASGAGAAGLAGRRQLHRSAAPLPRVARLRDQRLGPGLQPAARARACSPNCARRLADLHAQTGRKVSVIGWSLGGVYARELARESPDKVRQVMTLGSPLYGDPDTSSNASGIYKLVSGRNDVDPGERGDGPPPGVPMTADLHAHRRHRRLGLQHREEGPAHRQHRDRRRLAFRAGRASAGAVCHRRPARAAGRRMDTFQAHRPRTRPVSCRQPDPLSALRAPARTFP